jgi:hypothetical protein
MTAYGGWGGVEGGRPIDPDDPFEMTVNRVLGDRIRADDGMACAMWCALANVEWSHVNRDTAFYSFRAAGDMVAAIRGKGDYMDWYCCDEVATVSGEIAAAMKAEGWAWTTDF